MISDNNCIYNFSLLHINALSLCKNLNNITSYIDCLNHKFAVIAVSETWANISNESLLIIMDCNRVMKNRADSRGGGIALYVLECFQLDERPDLNIHANPNFECLLQQFWSKGCWGSLLSS